MKHAATKPAKKSACAVREIREARDYLAAPRGPFMGDDELLQMGKLIFELVGTAELSAKNADKLAALDLLPRLRKRFRSNLNLPAAQQSPLAGAIRKHDLTPLETELLVLIALAGLGAKLFNLTGGDVEDLSQIMVQAGHNPLGVGRIFQPGSRLLKASLIRVQENDPWIHSRVSLAPKLYDSLCRPEGDEPWALKSYADFLERISEISFQMEETAGEPREDDGSGNPELPGRLARLLSQVHATLIAHPDWPISPTAVQLTDRELAVILTLMGKDLGHLPCGAELYSGSGLAAGLGAVRRSSRRIMRLLAESATLRRRGLIRPLASGGAGGMAEATEDAIAQSSWELTDIAREQLCVPLRRRLESGGLRMPTVRLESLVLHEAVIQALNLSLAQARNPEKLFTEWGLGDVLGYGRGTTLLFSGPSGVGKTAAAEGLAAALGRPLLEADGSRLLNCWVGETEKNLSRIFREAAQTGAVLFFDEADAFFYDRSSAQRNWEVSHVNVLLRELERFEGLCILATNRRDCFDPAFERRLTLRVEFRPPTAAMAAQIWQKLMPPRLPLAADVDVAVLGALGLTGGQIKNAVLNAARQTLAAGTDVVTMAVLVQAARSESSEEKGAIGFQRALASGEAA